MGYNPGILHLQVGYNPFTNSLGHPSILPLVLGIIAPPRAPVNPVRKTHQFFFLGMDKLVPVRNGKPSILSAFDMTDEM